MKKEHESKKRLVILILAAAALCLAGGLCLYLAKIGKAAEPDRETIANLRMGAKNDCRGRNGYCKDLPRGVCI